MRTQTRLVQIQLSLYRRLQRYASRLFGGMDPELKKYAAEYRRSFPKLPKPASKQELLSAITEAETVLFGDYHTLSQAQKTVIRILREVLPTLKAAGKKPVLGLEMLQSKDNDQIRRYLSGELSEASFLKAVRFSETWGFSWDNYRPLFTLAKEHEMEIVGVNREMKREVGSLAKRDRFAAAVIAERIAADENCVMFVLIGDLHLAPKHLPKEIQAQLTRLGIKKKQVVIHQNEERYYWDLAEKGKGHRVDAVKWNKNEFCVLSASPWVKLHSHVNWVERDGIEEEMPVIAKTVCDFLKLPQPSTELSFESGSSNAVTRLKQNKIFSEPELKSLQAGIKSFESFFVPRQNVAFLSSASLNHAAAQAGVFLHADLSGYNRVFTSPLMDFYPRIWVEALGFLGSKIVNQKRRCLGPLDWKKELERSERSVEEKQALRGALDHLEQEKNFLATGDRRYPKMRFGPESNLYFLRVAKLLGELLGEALFLALIEHRVEEKAVRELFLNPFSRPFEARRLYLDWISLLDRYEYREIVKAERL